MWTFSLLAIHSCALLAVLVVDGHKYSSKHCQCRDGRNGKPGLNGRDGRDGRDGQDGRDGKYGYYQDSHNTKSPSKAKHPKNAPSARPSIHLNGNVYKSVQMANKVIDTWSTAGLGHVSGGMKYSNGQITVPVTGLYYIYCQVYYMAPGTAGRHWIIINSSTAIALGGAGPRAEPKRGAAYTGLSYKLNAGDKISCKIAYSTYIWAGTYHTFMGAFLY